jgi:hypothetical protein
MLPLGRCLLRRPTWRNAGRDTQRTVGSGQGRPWPPLSSASSSRAGRWSSRVRRSPWGTALLVLLAGVPRRAREAAVTPVTALAMIESLRAVGGESSDVPVRFDLTVAADDGPAFRVVIAESINLVEPPGHRPRGILVVQYPPDRPWRVRATPRTAAVDSAGRTPRSSRSTSGWWSSPRSTGGGMGADRFLRTWAVAGARHLPGNVRDTRRRRGPPRAPSGALSSRCSGTSAPTRRAAPPPLSHRSWRSPPVRERPSPPRPNSVPRERTSRSTSSPFLSSRQRPSWEQHCCAGYRGGRCDRR